MVDATFLYRRKRQTNCRRRRRLAALCFFPLLFILAAESKTEKKRAKPAEPVRPVARLVRVPLPIAGSTDVQVRRQIEQALETLPQTNPRPILVLEFVHQQGKDPSASHFGRALDLALFLSSEQMRSVKTVAWLPERVTGHAVLAVMACEQIVAHPKAELGAAGGDAERVDPVVRQGYTDIADRRRVIPAPVALAMLDRQSIVYRVATLDGVRYEFEADLAELEKSGKVKSKDLVAQPGELALLGGKELRDTYRFASHLVRDRQELASALGFSAEDFLSDVPLGAGWKALRVELAGPVSSDNAAFVVEGVKRRLADGDVNLLWLTIDSPGGAPADSESVAMFVAGLSPEEIRTVAFVPREARADAVLPALACDHLVMAPEAVLGGPGAYEPGERETEDAIATAKALGAAKHRDWSMIAALLNQRVEVTRHIRERTGERRYFSSIELAEQTADEKWTRDETIDTRRGLTGVEAKSLGLARALADDEAAMAALYGLEDEPETLRPNWARTVMDWLATPPLPGILLFGAWFFLFCEFMQPGLSVAGFLSALCFVLFFWAHFLSGMAGWLEGILFVVGVAFLALEIFVLPGAGAFGVGGGLLIIASVVLASQTFVIPRNAYQFEQLSYSLFMAVVGGAGALSALVLMRKALPHAPFFNRLMLPPPEGEELDEIEQREALAHYEHLVGKVGVVCTPLAPAGKARFGDEVVDVLSDGEWAPAGTRVVVSSVRGAHVKVSTVEEEG
jgi:membrane-bound ClpP family serine protease